jgi:hypothetical protein
MVTLPNERKPKQGRKMAGKRLKRRRRTNRFVARFSVLSVVVAVLGLVGATPAEAATVTYRSSATADNGAGATSLVIDKPTGTVQHDVMIAQITVNGNQTITAPAGWTSVVVNNRGNDIEQQIFSKAAGNYEGASYTFTFSASVSATGGISSYQSVDTTTPILAADSANSGNTPGIAATAPSLTTNSAAGQLIAFFGTDGVHTHTTAIGMTERYEKPSGGVVSPTSSAHDQALAPTPVTGTRSIIISSSSLWIAQSVALQPAPDNDNDDVPNALDNCPDDANTNQANNDGDSQGDVCDTDDDNDTFSDTAESNATGPGNAQGSDPFNANSTPEVCDGNDNDLNEGTDEGFTNTDGTGGADCVDTDDDDDGFSDTAENNATGPGNAQGSDPLNSASTPEVCDDVDNDLNEGTDEGFTNTDGDGQADCVDTDDDDDTFSDTAENNATGPGNDVGSDPLDAASTPETCDGVDNDLNEGIDEGFTDTDSDGDANCVDTDDDDDGTLDDEDAFPLDPNETTDTDGDNVGNNADTDDDNDTFTDTAENNATGPGNDVGSDPLDANSTPEVCDGTNNDGNEGTDEGFTDTDSDGDANCVDDDDDNDGTDDDDDAFPLDPTEDTDTDGDNVGNNADTDDDGDGQSDADETACGSDPLDENDLATDTDGDDSPNCVDNDDDGDGHTDTAENNATGPGNSIGSDPLDDESTPEVCDGTNNDGNEGRDESFPNTDGDGQANCVDPDDDNDGTPDVDDDFPLDPTEDTDIDGDGIGDNSDNCVDVANPDQADDDNDGTGNACEDIVPPKLKVGSTVTIKGRGTPFRGRVKANVAKCRSGRTVQVYKRKAGPDAKLGKDTTNTRGKWLKRAGRNANGRFYAKVLKKTFQKPNGQKVVCLRDRSPTVVR